MSELTVKEHAVTYAKYVVFHRFQNFSVGKGIVTSWRESAQMVHLQNLTIDNAHIFSVYKNVYITAIPFRYYT